MHAARHLGFSSMHTGQRWIPTAGDELDTFGNYTESSVSSGGLNHLKSLAGISSKQSWLDKVNTTPYETGGVQHRGCCLASSASNWSFARLRSPMRYPGATTDSPYIKDLPIRLKVARPGTLIKEIIFLRHECPAFRQVCEERPENDEVEVDVASGGTSWQHLSWCASVKHLYLIVY